MKILLRIIASMLLLSISICLPVCAQQQIPQANQPKEPDYVTSTGFKGKIFELKHRNPEELMQVIGPLSSGFKGARLSPSKDNKTITVRDFPENIASMEEAIKRLDVPLPPRPNSTSPPVPADVEVTAYILIASNSEATGTSYPPSLKEVITQLQITLNYKGYVLLAPIVQRTRSDGGSVQSNGTATLAGTSLSANYRFSIGSIRLEESENPATRFRLQTLQFRLAGASGEDQRALGEADINTGLTIRDGEKVVVGTASLKDKGLILVLTARVIK